MLSDAKIRPLLDRFLVINSDPREPRTFRSFRRFKSTRYVPEVVLLSHEGRVLGRLEDEELQEAGAAARKLKSVLAVVPGK